MRFWRRLRRTALALALVIPAGLVGTVAALGWSPPGRRFSSRLAESLISSAMNGRIAIGSIEGNLVNHVILRSVEIHDAQGTPIIQAVRIEAHYHLVNLYAGRLIFDDVTVDTAVVHLTRSRAERWNYQDAFRSGLDTTGAPSKPPLVQLSRVHLHDVSLRVDVPGTPKPAGAPLSRNATPPAVPRFEQGPDGPLRVYTAEHLTAELPLIRVSTPEDDPILVRVASMSTRLTDPAITITGLRGEFLTATDSLRFTLERASLPGTVVQGAGAVRWPRDTILFDFQLASDTVDLKDLRWISPDFPDWQGRGRVVALSANGTRTSYRLDQLRLGDVRASAAGSLTALVDLRRGLGFQGLGLALTQVPLEIARPYLDTLPFAGFLNGRLTADGFLDTMRLGGDLTFTDALVDSFPISHFVIDGAMHFGGNDGAIFDAFQLRQSAIPLATVRRLVPAVELPGTLALSGRLDGPWNRVTFLGTTEHFAPNGARSRMLGKVMLDTRDTVLALDLDATFDPLSFDGVRSGYPAIVARGGLAGHLALSGRLDSLLVDGAMTGEIGTVQLAGLLRLTDPVFAADSLRAEFARINTDALLGKWGETSFTGRAFLHGAMDTAGIRQGQVALSLDRSRIGVLTIEAAEARIRADSGLALIDTLQVDLPEGWVDVEGNLGLDGTHAGKLLIDAGFRTLSPFDSLVRALSGIAPDTLLPRRLGGTVHGNFTVTGSIDDASVTGIVQARDLVLDSWRINRIFADVKADSMGGRALEFVADADTLGRGDQIVEDASLRLTGRLDSLGIGLQGKWYQTNFAALARWAQRDSTAGNGTLDSLALIFPRQQWRLARPIRIAFGDGRPLFSDTLLLQTRDGAGQISVGGALPGRAEGDLTVSAVGVDVQQVASMFQRDSSRMGGIASLDLRLRGTADAPLLRGSAALTGSRLGDIRIPLLRAAFDYEKQRLRSQVIFWKIGEPLLQADLSLPIDLAFSAQGDRKLPGEIEITARADSADLGLIETFSAGSVRNARGSLDLDLRATGSWANPRFNGQASMHGGVMMLPSLNVVYEDINAQIRFTGDSVVFDTLRMRSDGGRLAVGGNIRFENLTSPRLDLNIRTSDFLLMDVPSYFTLRPSGEVALRGALLRPVLTGRVALANSDIYYSDLVSKSPIDISDPIFADLVDTVAIRKLGLGRSFQNRFMDSLRIDSLRFGMEEDVWLRSSQANILLTSEGDVRVSKEGKKYQIDGSFTAARGTYDLTLAYAITKTFNVDRGTVSFFGTTDLDASLSLQASHTVRTAAGEEIPVVASISGTILKPAINLTSPGRNLSEPDIISYLYFGVPASQIGVNSAAGGALVRGVYSSLLSAAASQTLSKNSLGVGVNFTGLGSNSYGAALSRQLGDQAFVTLSGGICRSNRVGAITFEYRLSSAFRLQTSYQPLQTCISGSDASIIGSKYQLGTDLLWRREY